MNTNYNSLRAHSTKARILAAIRNFNKVSIKNVANYCNLSIPMVTRYVESMLQEGLLKEQLTAVKTTGRRPKLFSLNADYGYVIGVELGLLNIAKIGVFTFDGTFIINTSIHYAPEWNAEEIIGNVIDAIDKELSVNHIDRKRILYIVIGNPGIVDPETGSIELAARSAKWNKLPLSKIFNAHFDVPVEVINDVNLSAIGEKEFGIGRGYSNFILIRQSAGLKAGIILKNRLYQGESRAAGEIGHSIISVMENGTMIYKNAESYLSPPAICDCIASRLSEHPNDIFHSITGGDPENVTIDNIVRVLGTPSYVNDYIAEAGEVFGYLLVNIVSVLDLPLVILSGEIAKLGNYYLKPARDVLSDHLTHPPAILVSSLGDDVALYGAFAVGQESVLASLPY